MNVKKEIKKLHDDFIIEKQIILNTGKTSFIFHVFISPQTC